MNSSNSVLTTQTMGLKMPAIPTCKMTYGICSLSTETEQSCSFQTKDLKHKKQGKYVCEYCNRACTKPSVLLKHLRSHTGERPYPCVSCGISFKTKSNLYKHKKSHAHSIKLGLVSGGTVLLPESDKTLCFSSDVEESAESEDESKAEEPKCEQRHLLVVPVQANSSIQPCAKKEQDSGYIPEGNSGNSTLESEPEQKTAEPKVSAVLPRVLVHPANISHSVSDSPEINCIVKCSAEKQEVRPTTDSKSGLTIVPSLHAAADDKLNWRSEINLLEERQKTLRGQCHAELQSQQASDFSQQEEAKFLLSPHSLGSTDSGYLSRSDSADQIMGPCPYVQLLSASETDFSKNVQGCLTVVNQSVTSITQLTATGKMSVQPSVMHPPIEKKSLEERISKLISENEAIVDAKQLDSVKPRRTSLSRRGSIDSPKSYIYKDSFHFDLKQTGRRKSSSSDVPKSPFTPTEKSKQVFLLSVPCQFPSLDCLPITRSNSMPASPGCSTVSADGIPSQHHIQGSQSFDEKVGSLCDDVFVTAPPTPRQRPRTLVRQTAVEDMTTIDCHNLAPVCSADEKCYRNSTSAIALLPRSKSYEQASTQDKLKKSQQGRGTMYECETCKNRYRKLENFENHKKFYCSELHGPKSKVVGTREMEHRTVPCSTQIQALHYRGPSLTSVLEQPPQFRKRRKLKSVGGEESVSVDDGILLGNTTTCICHSSAGTSTSPLYNITALRGSQQTNTVSVQTCQMKFGLRHIEQSIELGPPPVSQVPISSVSESLQVRNELKKQGNGISVIQHTSSLTTRLKSMETSDLFDRLSPVSLQQFQKAAQQCSLSSSLVIQDDSHAAQLTTPVAQLSVLSDMLKIEENEAQRNAHKNSSPLQQAKLVCQHNIQVPEILVTAEPDKEQKIQEVEQEKTELLCRPQRSETLSKLPADKLPPKKKRIQLTEMEQSSTESGFDSAVSRSLSRDSSLSHCSSTSVSFDMDEIPRTDDSPLRVDVTSKSSEFLMLPTGLYMFGVPRVNCRDVSITASEQLKCSQPSVNVTTECHNKSLDCGSMSSSSTLSQLEKGLHRVSPAFISSDHVPLIERRRGPLVRQMSLDLGPESSQSDGKRFGTSQQDYAIHVSSLPFCRPWSPLKSSPVLACNTQCLLHEVPSVQQKTKLDSHSLSQNGQFDHKYSSSFGVTHNWQQHAAKEALKSRQDVSVPEVSSQVAEQSSYSFPYESFEGQRQHFVPKYQLQINSMQASPSVFIPSTCTSLNTSPFLTFPVSTGLPKKSVSTNLSLKQTENDSHMYLMSQAQQMSPHSSFPQLQEKNSFVMQLDVHSDASKNDFAVTTMLPVFLTHDQINSSTAVTVNINNAVLLVPDTKVTRASTSHLQHLKVSSNRHSDTSVCKALDLELKSKKPTASEYLGFMQKVPSLEFSQQEATSSSKRMLSPENSLDISAEKHQKRAKEESDAACVTEQSLFSMLDMRNKQPKLGMPVRLQQLSSPQPRECFSLDQEDGHQQQMYASEVSLSSCGIHASETCKPNITEPTSDTSVLETASDSLPGTDIQKSQGPPFLYPPTACTHNSWLNSLSSIQNRSNTISNETKLINIHGQVKLATPFSVVNPADVHQLSFPTLKTSATFTWCYLMKRRPMPLQQNEQKTSAYAAWPVNTNNPNLLGLQTKNALSLFNCKQQQRRILYTQAINTGPKSDILAYSIRWKNAMPKVLSNKKNTNRKNNKEKCGSQLNLADNSSTRSEPKKVNIFDGGLKSSEESKYMWGHGNEKCLSEKCGIHSKELCMLQKHIRTHEVVCPHHHMCCNVSFKTTGRDLRLGFDQQGSYLEASDGSDEDDKDDEDSQNECALSKTPSVSSSFQCCSSPSAHTDARIGSTVEEQLKRSNDSRQSQESILDVQSKVLHKISSSSTNCLTFKSLISARSLDNREGEGNVQIQQQTAVSTEFNELHQPLPRAPCYQMLVDHPELEDSSNVCETQTHLGKSEVSIIL
ncbi:zinc finger protein 40 [Protopterus annectens]|uniref:zinc finger protein 40 n=1 Tax=Protopterus annectens TaxID=7888 RepID=UPI001CF9EC9A|nr:zinc finger protein 40 [Protopterus annectens]XP_043920836.1 zinc finger protein 40 [Protopterus annectens]